MLNHRIGFVFVNKHSFLKRFSALKCQAFLDEIQACSAKCLTRPDGRWNSQENPNHGFFFESPMIFPSDRRGMTP